MTTYANVGHVLLKRGNTVQSRGYTGPLGELTYDTDLGTVRVHNNAAAGGINILATQAQVNAINANLASAVSTISNSISTITGIDAIFVANINTLLANAAVQSLALGNLQAFQTYANATFGTSSFGNADVASYLVANPQPGTYSNANVEYYIGANIGSLWSNAATQATSLTTLTANAAAQATDITNLWSNAATQSSAITTLQGQVGQTYGNANVAAYLSTYTGNVSSGNLTVNNRSVKSTYTVQYLAVGGGGGGAGGKTSDGGSSSTFGGGGGAGGILTGITQFTSNLTYTITVGTGGAGNNGETLNGLPGSPTSIFESTTFCNVYAYGGGYGGGVGNIGGAGGSGGGGGGAITYAGGGFAGGEKIQYYVSPYGLVSQGTNGNIGYQYSGEGPAGTTSGGTGGGLNLTTTIGNVTATYSVGGSNTGGSSGASGSGNGGSGNIRTISDGYSVRTLAGSGGSGVAYITYCSPTQLGTGGTVWSYTQNGYTYWMHRFTSSGTYVA